MGTSEEISRRYPKDIDLREILMPPGPQFLRARPAEPQVHQRVPVRLMKPPDKSARALFERLGFHVEALLPDWVEDREGHTRDLLLMAYGLHSRQGHGQASS